ncbi:hypothetical protein QBC35DRAFT_379770 [Podospora australis]|uniref:Uncharacterized protein n=1 Tax=Podospora australis TaxID=1536484 RepID=A0AAN6X056_9PEZI|nr:hypothetical protein QBC35DRAFT_379770 [Podospora australis]
MNNPSVAGIGARILGEIEETSLDEVLASFRTGFATASLEPKTDIDDNIFIKNEDNSKFGLTRAPTYFPIPRLNDLVQKHFRTTNSAPLAITGRYHELLYILIATLIAPPHKKTVAVIDFEGRFGPLRLLATTPTTPEPGAGPAIHLRRSDLEHVYILRPPLAGNDKLMARCIASVKHFMLYGNHRSREREWWGTVVILGGAVRGSGIDAAIRGALDGDDDSQVAVIAGWKGWLRVDRAEIAGFFDTDVGQALADRELRQAAVERAGWEASSLWGSFTFGGQES